MDAAGFLPFHNSHIFGISGFDYVAQEGIQAPLGLFRTKYVFPEREGQEPDSFQGEAICEQLDGFFQDKRGFSVLGAEARQGGRRHPNTENPRLS